MNNTDDRLKNEIIEFFKSQDPRLLILSYQYAKNLIEYGVDISKAWETATQQSQALSVARQQGYYEAMLNLKLSEFKTTVDDWGTYL